ncbi:hypothetical protein SADUNF_Sadunf01G0130000 [Salix dunnii]|uniref:Peptidase S8/S53 domain-containing protein n=1 Tax=Salix dunnii TaxID=1413687 RepID=A0A835NBK4_9ROSI|nr:hypothetical protein SADUNF_Sadunf01G0130000 [Salix dunnii]
MASKPRIAAYKNCWSSSCYDSDILVAMDQDIYDGFHVISLYVSATHAPQYDHDSIVIKAFSASQYGIVVSRSTRNVGPNPYTTINREFLSDVVLGNGSMYWYMGSMSPPKVQGKIVAYWIHWTTNLELDSRRVEFNIVSCTSMSCPRVSGNVVLLSQSIAKLVPTTIKFALATTVYSLDNFGKNMNDLASGEESTPFIDGAGHADPSNAHNMDTSDNISFLCAIVCLMYKLHDHDLAFHFTKISIWRLWNVS